jgi:3-methyladenine DNA glycosylase AlkD
MANQRFFKEHVPLLGLDVKTMRSIKRDLLEEVGPDWTIRNAVAFCNAMIRDPHVEVRALAFEVVARFVGEASPNLLPTIKRWLAKSCTNWALVDNLAPSVLGPLLDRHPTLIPEVVDWTESKNLWVRRGAAVAFVPLARKGRRLATAYRIASRLFRHKEDLMHKAVGWLLREAGKTDMPRLEKFLLQHGPKMPRTTVRYAIERFPEADRKRLRLATRPTR